MAKNTDKLSEAMAIANELVAKLGAAREEHIIYHDIKVDVPSLAEIKKAIEAHFAEGVMTAEEAEQAHGLEPGAIESATQKCVEEEMRSCRTPTELATEWWLNNDHLSVTQVFSAVFTYDCEADMKLKCWRVYGDTGDLRGQGPTRRAAIMDAWMNATKGGKQ